MTKEDANTENSRKIDSHSSTDRAAKQTSLSRRGVLKTVAIGSLTVLGIGTSANQEGNGERYVVGTTSGEVAATAQYEASSVYRTFDFGATSGVTVGHFSNDAIERLEKRSDVRYVEKDATRTTLDHAVLERNEDPTEEQVVPWGIERIGAEAIHDVGETGSGASIAILDTGIDPDHQTLSVDDGDTLAPCRGTSCVIDWDDDGGHGTHAAGTACALDNDIGTVGVCPDADLYAVKVLDDEGNGSDSDIAAGIEWCVDHGIDVINMSFGGSADGRILEDAVEYAYDEGVLLVAAAGNAGPDEETIDYPANYAECIAVGATDENDAVPDWSSRGAAMELVAPGTDVLSTDPGDGYIFRNGTSMAGPHVAASGAWLMAQGLPNAENRDDVDDPGGARGFLRDTATDLDLEGAEQGFGLLNIAKAYQELDLANASTTTGTSYVPLL